MGLQLAGAQALFWQMSPAGQTMPQPPQLALSSSSSAQLVPQQVWVMGQAGTQRAAPELPPLLLLELEELLELPLDVPLLELETDELLLDDELVLEELLLTLPVEELPSDELDVALEFELELEVEDGAEVALDPVDPDDDPDPDPDDDPDPELVFDPASVTPVELCPQPQPTAAKRQQTAQ